MNVQLQEVDIVLWLHLNYIVYLPSYLFSLPCSPQVCPPAPPAESHHARSQSHGRPGRPSRHEAQSDAGRAAATAAATGSTATAAVPQTTTSTQSTSLDDNDVINGTDSEARLDNTHHKAVKMKLVVKERFIQWDFMQEDRKLGVRVLVWCVCKGPGPDKLDLR